MHEKSTQLNVVGDGLRVITAHAGKSTEEKSGYSFVHCKVTGTGTGIYLGRAWMSHPKVVYAYTDMSSVVNPSGWHEKTQTERDKYVIKNHFIILYDALTKRYVNKYIYM